jgi:hypothetical protein
MITRRLEKGSRRGIGYNQGMLGWDESVSVLASFKLFVLCAREGKFWRDKRA